MARVGASASTRRSKGSSACPNAAEVDLADAVQHDRRTRVAPVIGVRSTTVLTNMPTRSSRARCATAGDGACRLRCRRCPTTGRASTASAVCTVMNSVALCAAARSTRRSVHRAVDVEAVHRAAERLLRRPRTIGGQRQHLRQIGEGVAPEVESGRGDRLRVGGITEQILLPQGVIDVLHGSGGQIRGGATGAGQIGGHQVPGQRRHRRSRPRRCDAPPQPEHARSSDECEQRRADRHRRWPHRNRRRSPVGDRGRAGRSPRQVPGAARSGPSRRSR